MYDYRALYQAEKAKRAGKVNFSERGRPLCQYCGHKEARSTGKIRKADGSLRLHKFQGKYECGDCNTYRLYKHMPIYRNARRNTDEIVCY